MAAALSNPFAISRSECASSAQRMKEYILAGQPFWPKPPPATVASASTLSSSTIGTAASASATKPSAGDENNQTSTEFGPIESVLRAPCFYALFPSMWRRSDQRQDQSKSSVNVQSNLPESDVDMTPADQQPTTIMEGTTSFAQNVTITSPSSVDSIPTVRTLRLRPREPSRLLTNGSLGNASARGLYAAEFAAEISQRTAYISGHFGSGVTGEPPLSPGATASDPQSVSTSSTPSASVYHAHSRFSKPVSEMGDYLSLMRSSVIFRNPRADPLDDPNFIQHLAQQHWMGERAANTQGNGYNIGGIGAEDELLAPGFANMNSLSPISPTSPGTAPRPRKQPTGPNGQQRSASPGLSPPASPSSSPQPAPHARLTVDEADDLSLTDPSLVPPDSPVSPSPMPLRMLNNRRGGGVGGGSGRGRRMRTNIPSFEKFLRDRNTGGINNNATPAKPTSSTSSSSSPHIPSILGPGTSAGMNGVTTSGSPSSVYSSGIPPTTAQINAAKVEAKRARHGKVIEEASKALEERKKEKERQTNSPSISTLLSTMNQSHPKSRNQVSSATSSGGAPSSTSTPATPTLAPSTASPQSLLILYHLDCDLDIPLSLASRMYTAALPVYVGHVKSWFVRQLGDAIRQNVHAESAYEEAFHRWKNAMQSNSSDGRATMRIEWNNIMEAAKG